MNNYDKYNREERAICAHLFRLLHEQLVLKEDSPLGKIVRIISSRHPEIGLNQLNFENIGIYCEVAIIRDAFYFRKPAINPFMDNLTKLLISQESVQNCRLYSELPEILRDPKRTHPKQIKRKAIELGIQLSEDESNVYGAMQGMFNAKPDLVLTIDKNILVFEAKFTESFDDLQMKRTSNIAQVWAYLLFEDFGFFEMPKYNIFKLGSKKNEPDISWEEIFEIAKGIYQENDRSLIAFENGVNLLKQNI